MFHGLISDSQSVYHGLTMTVSSPVPNMDLVLVMVTTAVMKHHDQKQLKRIKVYLTFII